MSFLAHNIIILLAGLVGFFVSLHIDTKKSSGNPLICPLRANCDTVIRSQYSRFSSIPVEHLGLAYYGFVILTRTLILLVPTFDGALPNLLFIVSFMAAVFSLYLTGIQIFVLRERCTWCLLSAVMSVVIFGVMIFG